jgi:hypothetical protein
MRLGFAGKWLAVLHWAEFRTTVIMIAGEKKFSHLVRPTFSPQYPELCISNSLQ